MADKKEREYVCAYKYCLHHGQKVKASESVVINKKHYHKVKYPLDKLNFTTKSARQNMRCQRVLIYRESTLY